MLATTLALAIGTIGASAARAETYRHAMLQIINRTRTSHGLRPVELDVSLSHDARRWSRVMLRKDRVYDPPNLHDLFAPYNWQHLAADSVGCGMTLRRVHKAMMSDSVHRAIILHPKVRRVGIGIVQADTKNHCGRRSLWVSELYYG